LSIPGFLKRTPPESPPKDAKPQANDDLADDEPLISLGDNVYIHPAVLRGMPSAVFAEIKPDDASAYFVRGKPNGGQANDDDRRVEQIAGQIEEQQQEVWQDDDTASPFAPIPDGYAPVKDAIAQRVPESYLDRSVDPESLSILLVVFPGTKRVIPQSETVCSGWSAFIDAIAPTSALIVQRKRTCPMSSPARSRKPRFRKRRRPNCVEPGSMPKPARRDQINICPRADRRS
jgi:hypothetical protein